jgi:hypothetical protein
MIGIPSSTIIHYKKHRKYKKTKIIGKYCAEFMPVEDFTKTIAQNDLQIENNKLQWIQYDS